MTRLLLTQRLSLVTAALLLAGACVTAASALAQTSSSSASTPTLQAPAPVSDAQPVQVRITASHIPVPSPPNPTFVAITQAEPAVLIDNSTPMMATATIAVPAGPVDLWGRIRNGFGMPDLQDQHVNAQEQWYSTRPQYITRMTERSNKYLYHIVEELERRQMPTELALLPFIESAFNPQAVSSAKAAGMWQFMPSTGKYFE